MPDSTEDFTEVIARAQKVNKDIGGLFGDGSPGRVAFEPQPAHAGPAHDFDAHVDVFSLPADRDEYQEVLNQILRGDAILRYEDRTFTKDGDFIVAICYLRPHERPQPVDNQDAGDAEPEVRPHKIP